MEKVTSPLLSIIVPVYNVEEYLPRCIDSILSQIFTDFELILINDGSQDRSGEICDEYAQKDNKIIVIHQPNRGVSATRNRGLDIARGVYITFIDSDDDIERSYIGNFFSSSIPSNSLIVQGQKLCGIEKNKRILFPDMVYDYNHFSNAVVDGSLFFHGFAHGKLYKLDIIKRNKIIFDKRMPYKEDLDFMMTYMNCIDTIVFISATDYNYYIREDSLSHKVLDFDVLSYVYERILKKQLQFLQNHNSKDLSSLIDKFSGYGMNECIAAIYKNGYGRAKRIRSLRVLYSLFLMRKSGYPNLYKTDKIIKKLLELRCFFFIDLLLQSIQYLRNR